MKNKSRITGIILTLFGLYSCSSIYIVGNDFNDMRVKEIIIGETNESQIIGMFGEPSRVGKINYLNVFLYSYEEYEFPSQSTPTTIIDRKHKSLLVFFDENDVVSNFVYNVPLIPISLEMIVLDREMKQQQEENENHFNHY